MKFRCEIKELATKELSNTQYFHFSLLKSGDGAYCTFEDRSHVGLFTLSISFLAQRLQLSTSLDLSVHSHNTHVHTQTLINSHITAQGQTL